MRHKQEAPFKVAAVDVQRRLLTLPILVRTDQSRTALPRTVLVRECHLMVCAQESIRLTRRTLLALVRHHHQRSSHHRRSLRPAPIPWKWTRHAVIVVPMVQQKMVVALPRLSFQQRSMTTLSIDQLDRNMEGDYWLCEIQGPASQATERQAHATDLFEADWWIVRIKWYQHQSGTSPREYVLITNSTRWLSVSAIIRLDGLAFEGSGRENRSGVQVLSDDRHDVIRTFL